MAKRRLQGRARVNLLNSPATPSANPGKFGLESPLQPKLSASAGIPFPSRPRAALGAPPPRGAALGALRGLSQLDPRDPPLTPGFFPAPSRLPRVPVPASSTPAPPTVARALPAPPSSSRAAATTNEVRGRVRRFKRRLLREAGREIRRWGQNPAGGCEPCRASCCGERVGVGARGEEAERRREGPAEGESAPADMLGASLTGPGRG